MLFTIPHIHFNVEIQISIHFQITPINTQPETTTVVRL
jgi:hypothetical protein